MAARLFQRFLIDDRRRHQPDPGQYRRRARARPAQGLNTMALSTKITFSEEQAMLQDVAVNFCREKIAIGEVRRQIASDSGFDRELWKEISELGWLAVAVPEEFGGTNLSLAEVVSIVEPMGRHLAGTPFVSTQLFIQGLLAGGSEALRGDILP